MEKRKLKVGFNKGGTGGLSPRITLPITWLREMGISPEEREVTIYQIGKNIIISKEELKMEENKALEMVLKEIEKDIKDKYIDNSDECYYLFDIIKDTIRILSTEDNEEENIDEYTDCLYDEVVKYLNKKYKIVYKSSANGNSTVYYYDNCFDFKDVEELEKHFLIGE